MSEIILDFNKIGKLYSLRSVGTGTLTEDIHRWWTTKILRKEDPYERVAEVNKRDKKGASDYVWALKDISFQVERGEVIGILGKNGSGKSTLLKVLSRITGPTTGIIRTKGRIASLLEVGTGFHPDLTGRENVFMNGSILGMKQNEIKRKLDEIIEFSGVERFIDTPVKRYSSGMKVRLGFSVAAFMEPEVMVVDEVLAVGDTEYRRKAINKMRSIANDNHRTVLFVSHNTQHLLDLCDRGILLDCGRVSFDGAIESAVIKYASMPNNKIIYDGFDGLTNYLALTRAELNASLLSGEAFYNSLPIDLTFDVEIGEPIEELVIGFNLMNQYEIPLARGDYNDLNKITSLAPGKYRFKFRIPAYTLAPGQYQIVFDVAKRNVKKYTTDDSNLMFEVVSGSDKFGQAYNDFSPRKLSLFHENWLIDRECLDPFLPK